MKKKKVKESKIVLVLPLKDFKCQFDKVYDFKKGIEIEVPTLLLNNLKTEKVIK